jgi:hypothetical protein
VQLVPQLTITTTACPQLPSIVFAGIPRELQSKCEIISAENIGSKSACNCESHKNGVTSTTIGCVNNAASETHPGLLYDPRNNEYET